MRSEPVDSDRMKMPLNPPSWLIKAAGQCLRTRNGTVGRSWRSCRAPERSNQGGAVCSLDDAYPPRGLVSISLREDDRIGLVDVTLVRGRSGHVATVASKGGHRSLAFAAGHLRALTSGSDSHARTRASRGESLEAEGSEAGSFHPSTFSRHALAAAGSPSASRCRPVWGSYPPEILTW